MYDNAYRAVLLCRLAGLGFAETRGIVREVFGAAIPRSVVKSWYYGRKKHRMARLNALDKSLWYRKAYAFALKLKRKNPDWGHKRVATELGRHLPIRVPPLTVYFWLKNYSKPNITPIKICPELGYLVGVLVGDRRRTGHGLKVKDREFVEYYTCMYEKVTGKKPKIVLDGDGYYRTSESGGFLRALWQTGLWKVVAYIYPREFLQGLFDSEGCISPHTPFFNNFVLEIATGNLEVLSITRKLLKKLSYKTKTIAKPPQTRNINNKIFQFGLCYELIILGGKQAGTLS